MSPATTSQALQTATLLYHLSSVMAKQIDSLLNTQLAIGLSQHKILQTLELCQSSTQRQLGEQLGQTEASISRQVKLLSEDGYVHVRQNPANRREHQVILTRNGQHILDQSKQLLAVYAEQTLGGDQDPSMNQLRRLLEQYHRVTCRPGVTANCNKYYLNTKENT